MDSNNPGSSKGDGSDQLIIIEERISKANGENSVKKYARGKLLGKGGFAKCYEVTNLESKRVVAAKIIAKASLTKSRARQKLISEIKIHKSLHHVNIVNFEHVFEDQENVYILLEICANQTLNELLKRRKRLTELEVQCYMVQIVGALKYLHAARVIHRDLKLGNLFLSDKMEIKIGDFGLATKLEFEGEKKKTICGTPNYIAPEILDGKVGHSYEVDVWSLGVIIYTLLVGKPPFETPDVKTTYKKIKICSYSFPDHVPLSEPAKNLISRILNLDPSKRPSLDDIMNHPFINHGGTIPKLLPVSTIACPPSASYIKQFMPQGNTVKVTVQPQRLIDTAPLNQQSQPKLNPSSKTNLISTERLGSAKSQSPVESLQQTKENWNSTQNNGFLTGSTQNLRPNTVANPKDFKSTQALKTGIVSSTGNILTSTMSQTQTNTFKGNLKADIHVKKWVDYSSKYGLGYLLSNGMTGVFFNDSTKILLHHDGKTFDYIERRPNDRQDIMTTHALDNYPKDLQKKMTLLQHFKSYLEADAQNIPEEDKVIDERGLVYVKKWMKTRHAVMFRLSNKIVQVNFTDKTEIILSSENKLVVYVNKKGERSNYPLATALESPNTEMAKRLKYTKEILTHMLTNNNPVGTLENGPNLVTDRS